MSDETLSNLLHENRRFEPPADLAANANVKADAYDEADADPLAFWEKAADRLSWDTKWDQVLDWDDAPFAKWYVGGKINAAYNCVDRHVEAGNGDRVAYHWVGEPEDDTRDITYAELKDMVCQAANTLIDLGVKTGDRVAIYMPMLPETVVAMLACARIGAPHTVVFGGFSSTALRDRIQDCDARVVITSDGGYRRGAPAALKPAVDEALEQCPDVRNVLVVRRTGQDVAWTEGRDVWWHDAVDGASKDHTPEAFDSEHPLYVMYTSGTTGKPKGILHTTGRLPGRHGVHPLGGLRPQGRRRLLDRGRHRLGDRPLLHRLRPARQRHDVGDVRGHARHPPQGALVGDHREVQDHPALLRADGDPHVHEVGRGHPGEVRPVDAADHRLGRRADQPRGLRLVPRDDRRRAHPRRRHVVADRDRHAHDQPAARA